jgi:hypothetical protein
VYQFRKEIGDDCVSCVLRVDPPISRAANCELGGIVRQMLVDIGIMIRLSPGHFEKEIPLGPKNNMIYARYFD